MMVGIAGRSKGCKTCRKRKIACGLERPKCMQCIKSDRDCLGYDKVVHFVPMRACLTDEKLVVKSSFDEIQRITSTSQQKISASTKTSNCSTTDPNVLENNFMIRQLRDTSLSPASDMLSGSANRQQLLNVFISTCIPQEEGVYNATKRTSGPWMMLLPQLIMETPALQSSISAIAASTLGRYRGDRDLLNESLKFYTRALKELQMSLWDTRLMYNDEILAACLCLGLYEAMECPGDSRQAYYNHCKGCMRLIQGRGVSRHVSGVAHQLFIGLRAQGALIDIAYHKPSFLSSAEWMTGPWKLRPKRAADRIVDCLCEASTIYQEGDRRNYLNPFEKLDSWLQSLSKCWRMDAVLQEAYKDFEREFPQPMYWSVLSKDENPADDPVQGKVFPVAYKFPNIKVARSLMLYWAVSFMLWTGLSLLYKGIASLEFEAGDVHCSTFPDCEAFDDNMCHCRDLRQQASGSYKYDVSRLPSLGHRSNPKSLIDNVCQSIEYCMHFDVAPWGTWSAGTPLVLIYETAKAFPWWGREIAWMEATIRKLQQRGLRILEYSTTVPKTPQYREPTEASSGVV